MPAPRSSYSNTSGVPAGGGHDGDLRAELAVERHGNHHLRQRGALNGTPTIQRYTGGTCGVGGGSAVSGQLYQFTLTNEASGTPHSTTNTSHLVSTSSSVSWLVNFTSTDPNTIENSSHCESTSLTITN